MSRIKTLLCLLRLNLPQRGQGSRLSYLGARYLSANVESPSEHKIGTEEESSHENSEPQELTMDQLMADLEAESEGITVLEEPKPKKPGALDAFMKQSSLTFSKDIPEIKKPTRILKENIGKKKDEESSVDEELVKKHDDITQHTINTEEQSSREKSFEDLTIESLVAEMEQKSAGITVPETNKPKKSWQSSQKFPVTKKTYVRPDILKDLKGSVAGKSEKPYKDTLAGQKPKEVEKKQREQMVASKEKIKSLLTEFLRLENGEEKVQALWEMAISYSMCDKEGQKSSLEKMTESPELKKCLQFYTYPTSLHELDSHYLVKLYEFVLHLPTLNKMLTDSVKICIREKLENMRYKELLKIIPIARKGQDEDVLERAKKDAKQRWVEASNHSLIVGLIMECRPLNKTMCVKLQDKMLEYVADMSLSELIVIFKFLAFHSERNIKILKAIGYHLNQKSDEINNITMATDILFCCSRLFYTQVDIISSICNKVAQGNMLSFTGEEVIWPRILDSLNTSLAKLRYSNTYVFKNSLEFVSERRADLSHSQIAAILYAVASLGYRPPQKDRDVLKFMCEELMQSDLLSSNPLQWFQIIWSLCALDLAEPLHVSSVLQENFTTSLIASIGKSQTILSMLQNIDGYAKHFLVPYEGHRLSNTQYLLEVKEKNQKPKLDKAHQDFHETLTKLTPEGRFSKTNVTFPEGFTVDAEICINTTGKPQPLENLDVASDDCRKVAIKYMTFRDCTMPDSKPSGKTLLMEKFLKKMGYEVILISYKDWQTNSASVMRKVTYLQSQFTQVTPKNQ